MHRAGDKWDCMTLTAIEWDEQGEIALDGDGKEYVADTVSTKVVRLQCDCGSGVISVPYNLFRKREHPDCGCGRSWGGEKSMTSCQLPNSLRDHLDRLAKHKGMSRNQVIISALSYYLNANANQSSTSKQNGK